MTRERDLDGLADPYVPALVYLPQAKVAEFVTRDCACLYEEVAPGTALVRDMETREVIGFRIEDPKSWAAALADG
jgi:hypothetical protein